MAAGFKYNLDPVVENEERYDVQTGIRRRGPFRLDTTGLVIGSTLPSFTPIKADLVNRFAYVVKNVELYEDAAIAATSLKVINNHIFKKDDYLLIGDKAVKITAITKDASYDTLTVGAIPMALVAGEVLTEAKVASYKRTAIVIEATEANATEVKVTKGSGIGTGKIMNGSTEITISAVDTTNVDYDELTASAALGVIAKNTVLTEKTATGAIAKNVADSALYERKKVAEGELVALLRSAGEIEPSKLALPFSKADKENLKGWFAFNE